ncbi:MULTISPECIES: flagellin [Clostridium]|uniref:flagellin N-terminal helical domain-containing protein n=1 Tax=Clostridium TaxID=1485 RepID=UPI0008250630|nr:MULTISPECIES: flagellin [Clostridium]PJI09832.1 flagellin [Clostridium sp. CT7]
MIINHNLSGNTALSYLNKNQKSASASMEKLSSGLRINKAADDAAGLSISQKMQSQINGLDKAQSNAQDGISLIQTAEGGLNETQSILQRMNELATQAANDTNVSLNRSAVSAEMSTLADEINHISQQTNFNGVNLLSADTSVANTLTFQIGSTSNAYDSIGLNINSIAMNATSLSVDTSSLSVSNNAQATGSMSIIQKAIDTVSTSRAYLGAVQNRLTHTINNLSTEQENLTTANANITDVDMAKEMMNYSKESVLQQAAQSMLAQANQNPQQVLKLLQ